MRPIPVAKPLLGREEEEAVAAVADGDVIAGVPARRVGRLEMSVAMLKAKNQTFPWRQLIEKRNSEFDPNMEEELTRMRVQHFYGAPPASQKPPKQT